MSHPLSANHNPQSQEKESEIRALQEHQVMNEHQVRLFWLLAKILRRLARRITWSELKKSEKQRLQTTLQSLESDVQLLQIVLAAEHPLSRPREATSTAKAASLKETPATPEPLQESGLPRPPASRNRTGKP